MEFLFTALTALLSVAVLFILAQIMGRKQISELNLYDYINGITIGSIAAELATELEKPLKPLIAMIVYASVSVLLSYISNKHARARKFISGAPVVIMSGGKIDREMMKKKKLDLSELLMLCRQQGYFNLDDIETAVYENNGRLSVLPKSQARPANPSDMHLTVDKATHPIEVITDGEIMSDHLSDLGLNEAWLIGQLKSDGYKVSDIFLAMCDQNKKLQIFLAKELTKK
ncbi:MAG: DUF421 domain-containing protein [Firmicutes bacterium]|nr:DUF421 domain-containing protein [Bacillota bacterium]